MSAKDDQWFSPGDKVMRVAGNTSGRPLINEPHGNGPKYGVVYCVEDFIEYSNCNVVMIVGFGGWRTSINGLRTGWPAASFRRVEEIRLCVEAANKVSKPEKELQNQ